MFSTLRFVLALISFFAISLPATADCDPMFDPFSVGMGPMIDPAGVEMGHGLAVHGYGPVFDLVGERGWGDARSGRATRSIGSPSRRSSHASSYR